RIVGGGQPPTNLNTIDTQARIVSTVEDVAGELTLRVSTVRPIPGYRPANGGSHQRFTGAIDWVSANVKHVTDPPILDNAYRQLADCNTLARNVAGDGPDLQRLAHECPCCNRRGLVWDRGSNDSSEHHVRCTTPACTCTGVDCPCKLPGRIAGMRHAWIEARWNTLADQIKEAA
ncbi:MAG: hypothetical protein ABW022_10370, partial [Actinoplanes sp.]